MLYVRKLFTQDLRNGKQIAFPKEPSLFFFEFDYLNNEIERSINFTFRACFGQFKEYEGKIISTRIYSAGSESRMDGEVKAFIRDELNANVDDLLIFRNKGTKHIDFEFMFLPKSNPVYYKFLELINNDNHSVFQVGTQKPQLPYEATPLQQIFYGAPGTGKSHIINEQTENEEVIRTTFHPDSDYSTFVGAYKPTTKEITLRDDRGLPVYEKGEIVTEDRIIYEFVEQAFLQAYINAWRFYAEAKEGEEVKKQYLVIEEINRGNCAQIFGDLFQLLDRNKWGFSEYPIKADNDMRRHLEKEFEGLAIAMEEKINSCYKGKNIVRQVLMGESLLLPNNLYIWATMNTSDQSLFPIDSAFKRRWDWKYMPIDSSKENWCIRVNNTDYSWTDFLDKINDIVREKTQSEDKQLGFYFCKAKDDVIDAETFVGKVLFYLWNDVFKDYGFDDEYFVDEKLSDGSFKPLAFRNFYDVKTRKVIETQAEKFLKNLHIDGFVSLICAENDALTESGDTNPIHKETLSSVVVNGKRFDNVNMSQFDVYLSTIKELGVTTIAPVIELLKYRRMGSPLATKTPLDTLGGGFSYVEADGYYFVKGMNGYSMIRVLEDLKKQLNLDIIIEFK